MISEYLILISLIIVTLYFAIALVITSYLNKHKAFEKKQYQNFKSKVSIYLKIFFFFLISIILTRLIFSFQYPQQLHELGINITLDSVAYYFVLIEVCIVFIYSLFVLFFILFLKLSPEARIIYLVRVLKFNLLFSMLDLVISGSLFLKINTDMVFIELVTEYSKPYLVNYSLVLLAAAGMIACSALFYLTQIKATRNLQNWFFGAVMSTLYVSTIIGFGNIYYIIQGSNALDIFTFHDAFYAWLWLSLIFLTIGSQTAVNIIYGYKTKFINRFFAVNYIKQLNRVSYISILGFSVVAILPQLYLIIFDG